MVAVAVSVAIALATMEAKHCGQSGRGGDCGDDDNVSVLILFFKYTIKLYYLLRFLACSFCIAISFEIYFLFVEIQHDVAVVDESLFDVAEVVVLSDHEGQQQEPVVSLLQAHPKLVDGVEVRRARMMQIFLYSQSNVFNERVVVMPPHNISCCCLAVSDFHRMNRLGLYVGEVVAAEEHYIPAGRTFICVVGARGKELREMIPHFWLVDKQNIVLHNDDMWPFVPFCHT